MRKRRSERTHCVQHGRAEKLGMRTFPALVQVELGEERKRGRDGKAKEWVEWRRDKD